MTAAFEVTITDPAQTRDLHDEVELGHYFVFVKDGRLLRQSGRLGRLLGYRASVARTVLPLVDAPVELAGLTIRPGPRLARPIACLIADREVYRAEQDTVHLFVAMPRPIAGLRLSVSQNGAHLFDRPVELGPDGVGIESLVMLLAGRYEVELFGPGGSLGAKVELTVAEYTLAPLSLRLASHHLLRTDAQLAFDLAVTSYGVPFDRELEVVMLDGAREHDHAVLTPIAPGRYQGRLRLSGDGPFRIRATASSDRARIAEVVIPGSRRAERQLTRVSELGREQEVSLLPEPGALPVRGLFVTEGDHLATPLTVDEVIVTERGRITAHAPLESLVLVIADLATARLEARTIGDVAAGASVEVPLPSAMCTVFAGCFVNGHPFEGFTSFFTRSRLELAIEAPREVRPEAEVELAISTPGATGRVTCLVCVRDQRLTQADRPEVALAAAAKRGVEVVTAVLDDGAAFVPIGEALLRPSAQAGVGRALFIVRRGGGRILVDRETFIIGRSSSADLRISSAQVSRQHAAITRTQGAWHMEDLGSSNGVWRRGGGQVVREEIRHGDTFIIGEESLTFTYDPTSSMPPDDPFEDHTPLEGALIDEDLDIEADSSPTPMPAIRGATTAGGPPAPPTEDRWTLRAPGRVAAAAPAARRAAAAPPPYSASRPPPRLGASTAAFDGDLLGAQTGAAEVVDRLEAPGEPPAEDGAGGDRGGGGARGDGGAAAPEVRATFPEVLFFGTVSIEGSGRVSFPAKGSLGTYAVEVFALAGGDWCAAETTLDVDLPVRIDLDLPPAVHPEDRVTGRLRAAARGGELRVRVTVDDAPVALSRVDGASVAPGEVLPSPVELTLPARPGRWLAEVEDTTSGVTDRLTLDVGTPGKFKSYVRELALLQAGSTLTLDSEQAIAMRVLPALAEPFAQLVEATAGYAHLCCEQTGAKLVAATLMYLSAKRPHKRALAEELIIAGVAREETMWRRGRGFAAYPDSPGIAEHYTPAVVRYLWQLSALEHVPGLSAAAARAVRSGLEMAEDVAKARRMSRVPARIESMEDAYAVALAGPPGRRAEARAYVEANLDGAAGVQLGNGGSTVQLEPTAARGLAERARSALGRLTRGAPGAARGPGGAGGAYDPVLSRHALAYAAATLIATGELAAGIRIANLVTRAFNGAGRLYSTYDSTAAIALMGELERKEIAKGNARLEVNGQPTTAREVARSPQQELESIAVLEGVALVEVTRIVEEDWTRFGRDLELAIGFRDPAGRKVNRFRAGDRAELVVQLAKGYQMGDILHVSLPACMAWIHGGARVKRLSLDFAGKDELHVPLVVTAPIDGREHFAVCVRNMFQESRATSPGLLIAYAG